jgi:hypothetical protein
MTNYFTSPELTRHALRRSISCIEAEYLIKATIPYAKSKTWSLYTWSASLSSFGSTWNTDVLYRAPQQASQLPVLYTLTYCLLVAAPKFPFCCILQFFHWFSFVTLVRQPNRVLLKPTEMSAL